MRLSDRVAIVTGAGSGIGRAIAVGYAAEGAAVVVADLQQPGGQQTVEQINQAGGRALFVGMDVTLSADAQRMTDVAVATYGRLDVLVNNAAIGGGDDILATDEATWDRVVARAPSRPRSGRHALTSIQISSSG